MYHANRRDSLEYSSLWVLLEGGGVEVMIIPMLIEDMSFGKRVSGQLHVLVDIFLTDVFLCI